MKTGVYDMQFQNVETILQLIEAWTWIIDNKPIIIKPIKFVTIWISFLNIKLRLWFSQALSKMASLVGKPLFTDKMTARRENHFYKDLCGDQSRESFS